MSTNRVVIGQRANGNLGIFVSPSGFDAMTALDTDLLMNITSKISQLTMIGIAGGNITIPLGYSRPPFVFVTSEATISGIIGYNGLNGPLRPSPNLMSTAPPNSRSSVTINSNGASITFSISFITRYQIYSNPIA